MRQIKVQVHFAIAYCETNGTTVQRKLLLTKLRVVTELLGAMVGHA